MKFYHSTSEVHLNMIERSGHISRGDVPITPWGGFNAPWLSDRDIGNNKWSYGSGVNKTAVILEVELDDGDEFLCKWTDVMRDELMDDKWAAALNKGNDFEHWYIYRGEISLECVMAMTINGVREERNSTWLTGCLMMRPIGDN